MYRAPSANIETSTMAVCNIISLALNIGHNHFPLVGDFNCKDIDCEKEYVYQPGSKDNPSESKLLKCSATFIECVHDCLPFQHVKEPTRLRHGQNQSIIDLTFTNEEGMVDENTYLSGHGNSDHACLRFIFKCDKQVRQEFMPTYIGSVGSKLDEYDWSTELQEHFDVAYTKFTCCLNSQIEQFVAKRKSGCWRKNIYMTPQATRLKNKKDKLWKMYKA